MIDYSSYKQAMDEARDALEQAAAALKRRDLSDDVRVKLSSDLTEKAAKLRKLAMTFATESKAISKRSPGNKG